MNRQSKFTRLLLIIALVISTSCADAPSESEQKPLTTFETLLTWMTGEFDSSEQAANDSTYYDITLRMVPIWDASENTGYFYVEQSVTGSPDPYRQRVYEVKDLGDNVFESAIYLLDADSLYTDFKGDDPLFDSKSISSFEEKEGCAVMLTYDNDVFSGSTVEQDCASNFRGAAYATSEVVITSESLTSWDRGFGKDSTQVWGAEKGAYVFKRKHK